MIYRLLGAVLLLAVIGAGAYIRGCSDGRKDGQAELAQARMAWQMSFDKQELASQQTEAMWAERAKEIQDGLQTKLDAAESSVSGLSRRLRIATSRGVGTVSCNPAVASGDRGGSGPVPEGAGEIEQDADATWATGLRADAALSACVQAYNSLRD